MCEPINQVPISCNSVPELADDASELDSTQSKVRLLLNDNILSDIINEERLAPPLAQYAIHEELQKSQEDISIESFVESSLQVNMASDRAAPFSILEGQSKGWVDDGMCAIQSLIRDKIAEKLRGKELIEGFLKRYSALEKKIVLIEEQSWQDIGLLSDPLVIELLFKLDELCEQKKIEEGCARTILHFALRIVKNTILMHQKTVRVESGLPIIFRDVVQTLGELIYLLDQNPLKLFMVLTSGTDEEVKDAVGRLFKDGMIKIRSDLNQLYDAHASTQLQSPDIALSSMIPKVIANIILTSTGVINSGLINSMKEMFLVPNEPLYGSKINLSYALTYFQQSQKFRMLFENISRPCSSKLLSNDVIIASLNLHPKSVVSDLSARKSILSALLSTLRQSGDGSCFATSLAIEILSSHLRFCVKDLTQLVEQGKLTRTISGIIKDIPFMRKIHDENMYKSISVDENGYVVIDMKKKRRLWQAPGITAVCYAIGILKPKEAILAIIGKMPPYSPEIGVRKFTVNVLLEELCHYVLNSSHNTRTFKTLYDNACFTFSSQTVHPLLKAWENTIASMAEAREGGVIKMGILQSILYSLQLKLTRSKIKSSICIKQSLMAIQKTLFEKIELRYDPSIKIHVVDSPAAQEGGFVLYYRDQRIDNAANFTRFINDMFSEIYDVLKQSGLMDSYKEEFEQLFELFIPYVNSDDFLVAALAKYHHSNRLTHDLTHSYEKLNYTPWVTRMGNSSETVLEVYLEANQALVAEKFTVESTAQRLVKIIEMGQRMDEEEKLTYANNPHKLIQFRISGHHSGSLMLGHPSLFEVWLKNVSAEEWLDRWIINNPNGTKNSIWNAFTKESSDKMNIQVDTALCDSLDPALKKKLKSMIVHFADTNWSNNTQNLHFCFMVNPGTKRFEMWECTEDGNQLFAINQKHWLIDKEWEIFHFPKERFPDDILDRSLNGEII